MIPPILRTQIQAAPLLGAKYVAWLLDDSPRKASTNSNMRLETPTMSIQADLSQENVPYELCPCQTTLHRPTLIASLTITGTNTSLQKNVQLNTHHPVHRQASQQATQTRRNNRTLTGQYRIRFNRNDRLEQTGLYILDKAKTSLSRSSLFSRTRRAHASTAKEKQTKALVVKSNKSSRAKYARSAQWSRWLVRMTAPCISTCMSEGHRMRTGGQLCDEGEELGRSVEGGQHATDAPRQVAILLHWD